MTDTARLQRQRNRFTGGLWLLLLLAAGLAVF